MSLPGLLKGTGVVAVLGRAASVRLLQISRSGCLLECSQAMAPGTVATLGLDIDATASTVYFTRPRLPEAVSHLHIGGLAVGDGSLDLVCSRHAHDVDISVFGRSGDVRVVVVK